MATEPWSFYAAATTILLMSAAGTAAHVCCVVGVLRATRWRRNAGLQLVLSLSVSDALGTLALAAAAVESLAGRQFGAVFNRTVGYVTGVSWASMALHLVVMALNRAIRVLRPFHYDLLCGASVTLVAVALVWLVSVLFATSFFALVCTVAWTPAKLRTEPECAPNSTQQFVTLVSSYAISAVSTVLPALLYFVIALKSAKKRRMRNACLQPPSAQWRPFNLKLYWQFSMIHTIYAIVTAFWPILKSHSYALGLVQTLNYSINPFLYLAFNKVIREAMCNALRNRREARAPVDSTYRMRPVRMFGRKRGTALDRAGCLPSAGIYSEFVDSLELPAGSQVFVCACLCRYYLLCGCSRERIRNRGVAYHAAPTDFVEIV